MIGTIHVLDLNSFKGLSDGVRWSRKELNMTEWLNNDNKAKQVDNIYLIELDKILQNMCTFLCISKSKPIIKSRKNIFCFPLTWVD